MPTISAVIKYTTNLDDLRRELKSGTDQLVVLEKAAERTTRNLGGEGIMRAAHNAAAAIQQLGGTASLTAKEQDKVNSLIERAIEKMEALNKAASAAGQPLMTIPTAFRQIADETKRAEEPVSKFKSLFGDLGKEITATAAGFVSAQAIIGGVKAAFNGLTEFVTSSIKAYTAQETAVKRMTTALQAQGQATPEVIEQYKAMASQFQQTTVFSDELINEMQALLVEVGDVMPKDMDTALKSATDLASGLGVDLRTATLLVGKAFEGETGTLKRYGIVIDETKLKTQGITAVLDAIQQKFGGQAQSELETYAGKLKQMSNAWDEVKEKVGEYLISDPILETALRTVKQHLDENSQAVIDHNHSWSDLLRRLNAFGEEAPNPLARVLRMLEDMAVASNALASNMDRVFKNAPKLPQPDRISPERPGIPGADMKEVREEWDRQIKVEKEAKEAAEQHAKAIRDLMAAYSGAKDIKAANDVLEAINLNLKKGITISEMSEEQQIAVNQSVTAAIEVYNRLGKDAPKALVDIQRQTQGIIDVQEDAKESLDEWSETIRRHNEEYKAGEQATMDALEQIDKDRIDQAKSDLDDYAEVVKQHQQDQKKGEEDTLRALDDIAKEARKHALIVLDAWDRVGATLEHVGSAFDNIFGRVASGAGSVVHGIIDIATATSKLAQIASTIDLGVVIGEKLRPLLGLHHGKLGELLGTNASGREEVLNFAVKLTGTKDLDALHALLQEKLPAEAERFWVLLTQGTGRANAEQAKKNIQTVVDALNNAPLTLGEQAAQAGFQTTAELKKIAVDAGKLFEYMRDSGQYSADAVQQAWERAQQALIASGEPIAASVDKAKKAVADLDAQIASLNQSIANEAPEEEMGVIERNTRAQIASLEQQREAAAATLNDLTQQMTDGLHDVADALRDLPKEIELAVHARVDVTQVPGETPEPDRSTNVSTGGLVTAHGVQTFTSGVVVQHVVQHFAVGGHARGTDTVPAMLTPGEVVLNAAQQKNVAGAIIDKPAAVTDTARATDTFGQQRIDFEQQLQAEVSKTSAAIEGKVAPAVEGVKDDTAALVDHFHELEGSAGRWANIVNGVRLPTMPDATAHASMGGMVIPEGIQPLTSTMPDVLTFADGGFVPRGTDTVPAMLTPGEIVLNAAQQKHVADAITEQPPATDATADIVSRFTETAKDIEALLKTSRPEPDQTDAVNAVKTLAAAATSAIAALTAQKHEQPSVISAETTPVYRAVGGVVPETPIYRAIGGDTSRIAFRPSGTDSVPAMLTPGEIILNAAQQKNVATAITVTDRAPSTDPGDSLQEQSKAQADALETQRKAAAAALHQNASEITDFAQRASDSVIGKFTSAAQVIADLMKNARHTLDEGSAAATSTVADKATRKYEDVSKVADVVQAKASTVTDTTARRYADATSAAEVVQSKATAISDSTAMVAADTAHLANNVFSEYTDVTAALADLLKGGRHVLSDRAPASTGGLVTPRGILAFTSGGAVPWSLDSRSSLDTVPAMLTPGEIVLNASQQRNLSSQLTSGMGAPRPTTVVLEVDGRALARAQVPVFPGEAQRLGMRVVSR